MKKFTIKFFFIFALIFLLIGGGNSQDRKQLEKKKKQTEEEIRLTKKILEQTGKEKKDNLHALNTIRNLIKAREKLIYTLSQQVNQVSKELEEQREELVRLEIRLAEEKENFSKLIVTSYKTRSNYNELAFIFSSSGFFNAINRLKFLKLLNTEQDRLVESIANKKEEISLTIIRLEELKAEKEALLENRMEERTHLEKDREKKDEIVKTLSGKEEELKSKLKKQQAAFDDLNQQIKLAIQREMEEARKKREAEAKKKGTDKENINLLTPEAKALSDDFAGNRLKLPWPVEKGFVTQKFGRFAHQTLSGIYIENNGIDIATEQNVKARAVFRGEVSAIFPVPGMGKAVLINHGEYYTVYARLEEVYVKQGQKINIKESLGLIMTDENGKTELHFEVWKNQEKLNPELWLTKR
jgi:septal ring factor EnvC (AmiA/AmiB activator)